MEDDQLTPSEWGAVELISTHVLRMEDDVILYHYKWIYPHFNPRPPHGGRLVFEERLLF